MSIYPLENIQGKLVQEGSAYDAVALDTSLLVNDVVVSYALVNKEYGTIEFLMSTEEGIRAALYAKEVGEIMANTQAEGELIAFLRQKTEGEPDGTTATLQ